MSLRVCSTYGHQLRRCTQQNGQRNCSKPKVRLHVSLQFKKVSQDLMQHFWLNGQRWKSLLWPARLVLRGWLRNQDFLHEQASKSKLSSLLVSQTQVVKATMVPLGSKFCRYVISGTMKGLRGSFFHRTRDESSWILGLASFTGGLGLCFAYINKDRQDLNVSQCDVLYSEYAEEPISYGSSSDPLIMPFSLDQPEAFLVPVQEQPRNESQATCLQQSIRAFLAASRVQLEGTANVHASDSSTHALSGIADLSQNQQLNKCVTTDRAYFYSNPRIVDKKEKFVLLAGPASLDLGLDIATCLGVKLNQMQLGRFADGETSVQIDESVRGKSIFIVQSTSSSDSIMQLLLLISTLRRASAKTITVVIPYYGYARQDQRKNRKRETIAAADVAIMLEEMGTDNVMCVDVHSPTIHGFFSPKVTVEHLLPGPVAAAYFYEELMKKWPESLPPITVVASHEGQVQRASHFLSVLQHLSRRDIEVAILTKDASGGDPTLTGDVKDRVCIMVDDIINTGTTVTKSVKVLKESGASIIFGWATHGVFTKEALEKLDKEEHLEFFLTSNSLDHEKLPSKIRNLNVAPLLAEAIARMFHNESLQSLLDLGDHASNSEVYDRYDSDL